jgi:hypothetical protein
MGPGAGAKPHAGRAHGGGPIGASRAPPGGCGWVARPAARCYGLHTNAVQLAAGSVRLVNYKY